jgi:hypothetical protein
LIEVLRQLILANDLGFINEDELLNTRNKIETIGLQINALKKSQIKQINL